MRKIYESLDDFFAALDRGDISHTDIAMSFEGFLFIAKDTKEEHTYIAVNWKEVYGSFEGVLKAMGVQIVETGKEVPDVAGEEEE